MPRSIRKKSKTGIYHVMLRVNTEPSSVHSPLFTWNKGNPSRTFDSEILEDIPAGKNARITALEREKQYADKY